MPHVQTSESIIIYECVVERSTDGSPRARNCPKWNERKRRKKNYCAIDKSCAQATAVAVELSIFLGILAYKEAALHRRQRNVHATAAECRCWLLSCCKSFKDAPEFSRKENWPKGVPVAAQCVCPPNEMEIPTEALRPMRVSLALRCVAFTINWINLFI